MTRRVDGIVRMEKAQGAVSDPPPQCTQGWMSCGLRDNRVHARLAMGGQQVPQHVDGGLLIGDYELLVARTVTATPPDATRYLRQENAPALAVASVRHHRGVIEICEPGGEQDVRWVMARLRAAGELTLDGVPWGRFSQRDHAFNYRYPAIPADITPMIIARKDEV